MPEFHLTNTTSLRNDSALLLTKYFTIGDSWQHTASSAWVGSTCKTTHVHWLILCANHSKAKAPRKCNRKRKKSQIRHEIIIQKSTRARLEEDLSKFQNKDLYFKIVFENSTSSWYKIQIASYHFFKWASLQNYLLKHCTSSQELL